MNIHSADDDASIDSLLVLPADEIRYDSLSTSVLSSLATQTMDAFIATSALGELAQRGPQETTDAAECILDGDTWDGHLTAFALTLLYDRAPERAIPRMATLAVTCEDPTILAAMIENILSDSERFQAAPEDHLAGTISHRVAAANPEAFKNAEQRDRFLKLFPALSSM
jgi:hypothetical protein